MIKKVRILLFILLFFQRNNALDEIINIKNYNYDYIYKNFAIKKNQETAIIVFCYNRPDYFKQCITSIEKNLESLTHTFIFAVDGGPRSKQKEYEEIILQSKIKNSILLFRSRNYGCPKNHIDGFRFAFDWCKFNKLIIMQDDIVISPTYFTFLLHLHTWAKDSYDNIGVIQAWDHTMSIAKKEKKNQLNYVKENLNWWSFVSFCMDNNCWHKIKFFIEKYELFIDKIPLTDDFEYQRSKPYESLWKGNKEICEWIYSFMHKKNNFLSHIDLEDYINSRDFGTNSDIVLGCALYLHNLIKLTTPVNRIIHIGKNGISLTEELHHLWFGKMNLDIFEEDKDIKNFVIL